MTNLNLGVIGNCTLAMLVDNMARIVWGCFPRLDGDPIFNALLGGEDPFNVETENNFGYFGVEIDGWLRSEQTYDGNLAILKTLLVDGENNAVDVVDFAPRYSHYDRLFRPPTIVRRLIPVTGTPRIRIRLRPSFNWGKSRGQRTIGSNHLRFVSETQTLRLTTDIPISSVVEEIPFTLDRPMSLIFGSDEALLAGIEETSRMFYERTLDYWRNWVLGLSVPFDWQEEAIRAAITLKLCNYEETGAIVAALTTSIPESPGTERNWDYRLCWPRDAYFVVHALNRLGTTRTMENYLNYILNIVSAAELLPVYTITRGPQVEEGVAPALPGYRGMGPVRIGNQAHQQTQNDVYGSVILAATHMFFDKRLARPGSHDLFARLEILGTRAARVFDRPDAGPWEFRGITQIHTFSSLMCWAACDRLSKIAHALGLEDRKAFWAKEAGRLRAVILKHCWNERLGSFVSVWDGEEADATLLLLHELGFLATDDARFSGTVAFVSKTLRRGDLIMRYAHADDFGPPETAFTICTFWYVDALASLGKREEAQAIFESILARRNPLGLLSEDIDPRTGELWGNFPQAYSMVGLINSAMRLTRSWEEAF
jgi:GH15 family glucan-1,4-alpha-glucosidase